MFQPTLRLCLIALAAWSLGACQSAPWSKAQGYGEWAALEGNAAWQVRRNLDTDLPLVTAVRRGVGEVTWVYIEGDGRAFLAPTVLSDDPTPRDPIALRLALAPQDATVVYLGRPCQYVMVGGVSCQPKWWSTARYGEAVLLAMNRALDRALPSREGKIVLVGYSGGGNIAAILAARRTDVAGLVTVAANLDTAAWATHHRVTPLHDSVNPASVADALAHTPQVHMIGGKDTVVPRVVTESFMAQLPKGHRARVISEPVFDHNCCWVLEWKRLREAAIQALKY